MTPRSLLTRAWLLALVIAASSVAPLNAQEPDSTRQIFSSNQTDILVLRTGEHLYGEFKSLARGQVTYKTDAMSTVQVKWPRVVTVTTNKQWEIQLDDEHKIVGSLLASDSAGRVIIQGQQDTTSVDTQSIVKMTRIKKTFWNRLDGNVNLGANFTQQNAKLDLQLDGKVTYTIALHRASVDYSGSYASQDSVENITRQNLNLVYAREFSGKWRNWFWSTGASWQSNSQLDLDLALSVGTGPGRLLVSSNKVLLTTWLAPWYRREVYTDADGRNAIPLLLATDFELFQWAGLSTDLSSRLGIAPVLNDSGRWLITLKIQLQRELFSNLYLNIGINEYFDSKPPTDTARNDFSINTSLGWTF